MEGVLGEYADGTSGQVALCELPDADRTLVGILVASKEGPVTHWTFRDLDGREHPDVVDKILDAPALNEIPAARWAVPGWAEKVRSVVADVDLPGRLTAVAGILLRAD